jgi:integrase
MSVYRRNYAKELGKEATGEAAWAYCFRYRKVRYRSAGFKTKREAELAQDKARSDVIVQGRVMKPFQTVEFVALAEEVLSQRECICAPMTVACERTKLKSLAKFFAGKPVHKITAADINWFIRQRKGEGISNRTVNMALNFLRVMFKHALMSNCVTFNPMTQVKNLPEPLKDRPILSMDDFNRLLLEAGKLDDPQQLLVWLKLRAYSGLRPSEAVYLEWPDINWERNLIIVRPKDGNRVKDGEFRAVPIHPELKPALLAWKSRWEEVQLAHGMPHKWVFFYPADPTQRALGFRRSFVRACKNAGIPNTRSYDFRHFFISEAVMAGCELMAIAKWAGHGSVSMIEKVYGHLRPEYHAAQIAKIGFGPLQEKSA